MSAMGAKLRRVESSEAYRSGRARSGVGGIAHWCPACNGMHLFALDGPNASGAKWTWNGNIDHPTFMPSMLIKTGPRPMVPEGRPDAGKIDVCHYILTDGVINFCGDCTHGMAGQSVSLPDWPYAHGTYGGIEE